MSNQPKKPNAKKRPPILYLGSFLSILGGSLAGAFIARQLLEAGTGHTYYEFVGGGTAIAATGIIIVFMNAMKRSYHHTQIGYPILALLAFWILAFLPLLLNHGLWTLVTHTPYGVVIVCLLLFVTLTIEIDDGCLVWSFGPGLIRKRVPLAEIAVCEVVRYSWYYGVGIRRIPKGWLYNVSGTAAVRITLKDGKFISLGSDRAEYLCAAIQSSLTK